MKRFLMSIVASIAVLSIASVANSAVYLGPGKTTINCIDRDGDGYGTGPSCVGRDADDKDTAINTVESWKATYTTLDALLAKRGYVGILRYWFVDSANGDDTTCKPDTSVAAEAIPCRNWGRVRANVKPGDVVVFREGSTPVGSTLPMNVSGTVANPILLIGYPGESFVLDRSNKPDGTAVGDGISGTNLSNLIFDGFTIYSSGGLGNAFNVNINPQNVTVRNMEMRGGYTHLRMFEGLKNITIEENLFAESKATESVYLGARGNPGKDVFFRNNIIANVSGLHSGYPAVQYNGRGTNYVVEGNIVYGFEQCFSFVQGVSHSTFRRNLCFGGSAAMLTIWTYPGNQAADGTCPANGICPYDQTDNLIEYNTLIRSRYNRAGDQVAQVGAFVINNRAIPILKDGVSTVPGEIARTTFRNNIVVGWGNTPLVMFKSEPDLAIKHVSTSRFTDNVWWKVDTTLPNDIFMVGFSPTTGLWQSLTPEQFAPLAAEYNGNIVADPKFVHYDFAEWANPELADFHLQPDSPAQHAGIYANAVEQPPVPIPTPKPTLSITAVPTTILAGESSTLTWDSNNTVAPCHAWDGDVEVKGNRTVTPQQTTIYPMSCVGQDGSTATAEVVVNVTQPPPPVEEPPPSEEPPPPTPTPIVPGSRINVIGLLDVRDKPNMNSGKVKCKQEDGAVGTVLSGPTFQQGYTWYRINFVTRCDGYVHVGGIIAQ